MPAEVPQEFEDNQLAANLWRDLTRLQEDAGDKLFLEVTESIISELKEQKVKEEIK